MKYLLTSISILVLLLTLSSCKDDFNINGNAEESAVVYALLDPSETTHFIKVTKAFVTTDSNLDVAGIADSSYFNKVTGTVEEFHNGAPSGREWQLVDTMIENKESGVFYYPLQRIYMFKTSENAPLKAEKGYTYKLKLNINDGEFEVFGETELVRDVKITSFANAISKMQFANSLASNDRYRTQLVNIDYGSGQMYDLRLNVYYSEFTSANDSTIKSFTWRLREGNFSSEGKKILSIKANGETFYQLMKQNVKENDQVIRRNLEKIDVVLTVGSQVLDAYINVNKPTSNLAQNKITYTNLEATNERRVMGIFTARTTAVVSKRENYTINGAQLSAIETHSMRELCKGQYTGLLNFCSPDTKYQAENFYCH